MFCVETELIALLEDDTCNASRTENEIGIGDPGLLLLLELFDALLLPLKQLPNKHRPVALEYVMYPVIAPRAIRPMMISGQGVFPPLL